MKKELLSLWKKHAIDERRGVIELLPEALLAQASEIVFGEGAEIVSAGAFPEYIYFVLSGTVEGVKYFENGERYQFFSLDTRNGGIGLMELFARQSAFVASVVATSEVRALALPSAVYYEYALKSPELLKLNLYYVARDLYKSSARDGMLFFKDGMERVKYFLADYYSSAGGKKELAVEADYEKIAVTLGLSVRTVGRSIRRLREEGLVGKRGRRLTISAEQYKKLKDAIER
ncbi:MAG: Crp/Fnr family transcriptional regulator [Oscillospiraceae bacterium]|nr:Crp/Fnr family transcriptional regulator [Oscillospiraceae bacterium]